MKAFLTYEPVYKCLLLLLLLLECKFISQIISKGYVHFDGGGVVLSLLNLTRANISDLFSICLHSKEFKFLQEGGLCKEINKEMFYFCKNRHERMVGELYTGARYRKIPKARPESLK